MTTQQTEAPNAIQKTSTVYEFTKRKRWADLSLNEAVDAVFFILSPTANVLFCGSAITETLGWKDSELVDLNMLQFVAVQDHDRFSQCFNRSRQTVGEVTGYIHFKTNEAMTSYASLPPEVYCEIRIYPHNYDNDDQNNNTFYVSVAPYPTRNSQLLNTSLELFHENLRLMGEVLEAKNRLPTDGATSSQSSPHENPIYATSSLKSSHSPASNSSSSRSENRTLYLTTSTMAPAADEKNTSQRDLLSHANNTSAGTATNSAEEPDECPKKKKVKRSQIPEQYVCITCGRTNSPEWRKGPLGPKTLCNACGLRWAKQNRRVDEPAEASDNPAS